MSRPAAVLLSLLALWLIAPRAWSARALTPAEYDRVLTQADQQLAQAARAGKSGAAQAKRALAALPERVTVARSGAAPVEVDNRDLLPALRDMAEAGPEGLAQARETLGSLRQASGTPVPSPPANARPVLARVLARREFQLSWWDRESERLWARIDDWLRRLNRPHWPRRSRPHLDLSPWWQSLGVAALVGCGAAMLLLLVRLLRRRVPPAKPEELESAARPRVILPYQTWLEEAERHLRAAEYRAGVRALHMAALMRLDDAGLVGYDHAYTDSRFVRVLQARDQTELARTLARLNRVFAQVWYGHASSGATEYAAAQQLWRDLEAGGTR